MAVKIFGCMLCSFLVGALDAVDSVQDYAKNTTVVEAEKPNSFFPLLHVGISEERMKSIMGSDTNYIINPAGYSLCKYYHYIDCGITICVADERVVRISYSSTKQGSKKK